MPAGPDIARIGDRVYAGGIIDSVTDKTTGTTGTYGNALMFNARTGAVSTGFHRSSPTRPARWRAAIPAVERSTDGTALWFGGEFKKVDGVVNRGLIRWDVAANKQNTVFKPNIGADNGTARVYDVKYFCGRLWVAGDFTSAGGVARTALVSLNPTTGAATGEVNLLIGGTASANAGPTRITKIAPSPDCKRVVLIGNFTRIANHVRYQVAVVNVSPTGGRALLAPWDSSHLAASQIGVGASGCGGTALTVWPRDVDWAPDGTWWALAGTGGNKAYPALCDSVSRWTNNDSTNAEPVWINYSGGDTFLSVRVTGAHVYVGGHFRVLDHVVYRQGVRVASTDHEHFGLPCWRPRPAAGCPSQPGTTARPPAVVPAGPRCCPAPEPRARRAGCGSAATPTSSGARPANGSPCCRCCSRNGRRRRGRGHPVAAARRRGGGGESNPPGRDPRPRRF